MDRAVVLGRYALEHARAAFGLMAADPATTLAKHIWAWCGRSDTGSVTRHAMHRAMQWRVERASNLDAAIAVLVERALLREVHDVGPRRRGRPSSPSSRSTPARGNDAHVDPIFSLIDHWAWGDRFRSWGTGPPAQASKSTHEAVTPDGNPFSSFSSLDLGVRVFIFGHFPPALEPENARANR